MPQDIESLLAELRRDREPGTVNRYRDLLSAMFKRALHHGHVDQNPVRTISKSKEPAGRGLRYGEQMALRWRDADMLTGLITVRRSKNNL